MRRMAVISCTAFLVLLFSWTIPGAEEARFASVSSDLQREATTFGIDMTGEFGSTGGTVTVVEMPSYVDPSEGLVMMVGVIAKAGDKLIDRCAVSQDYPIKVVINGAPAYTTAGLCRAFLKNPGAEGISAFWTTAQSK
jgi:hypothetical protein